MKKIKVLIKRGINNDLLELNPVLEEFELCCIKMESGEYTYKIGDGKTPYNDLPVITNISDIEKFIVYDKVYKIPLCEIMINSHDELYASMEDIK